ncbi:MAG: aminopeptidase P family N-terminal domain-containing protein, partial [Firmicutes bacterium]|nr:aminopeptidase P family N-terminal domain-containing protein [Bacillota bacterium]
MKVLAFEKREYCERLKKVKESMQEQGIEVLLITDPANINYVAGYEAMSYYVPQGVVVTLDMEEPVCIIRQQDLYCATQTTWVAEENVIAYPDKYLWEPKELHVMDFIADFLKVRGLQIKK